MSSCVSKTTFTCSAPSGSQSFAAFELSTVAPPASEGVNVKLPSSLTVSVAAGVQAPSLNIITCAEE